MMRAWLGVGLLAASWTAGLGYYQPVHGLVWLACVVVGAGLCGTAALGCERQSTTAGDRCLGDTAGGGCATTGWATIVAGLLLVPGVWWMPWPYRAAPALVVMGLALPWALNSRPWSVRLAEKARTAGLVLFVQAVAILLYAAHTARSHELPDWLGQWVGLVAQAAGAEASVEGSTLSVWAGDRVQRLGATWDLLVDPATLLFLVGGLAAIGLAASSCSGPAPGRAWSVSWRAAVALLLIVGAWLPVRLALVVGLFVARVEWADSSLPLGAMNQMLSWWLPCVLLVPPALLAAWLVKWPWCEFGGEKRGTGTSQDAGFSGKDGFSSEPVPFFSRHLAVAGGLVAVGAAVLMGVWLFEPVGTLKGGRVTFVERHSRWEPTTTAYDDKTYGEPASYTYRLLYDYAGRFFHTARLLESDRIDAESLRQCDVLVVKTPTAPFSPEEVEAIVQFVHGGGGLLLIGDHTNVFNSTAYLNDVARRFGFALRDDLLFRVGTPFEQPYRRGLAPHPAVGRVERMDFAVSCSVDPGTSSGRAAIEECGLWSLPAQYENENYHPPAEYRATMRAGPFVQLWAARAGGGRVLAFTDSTIFSNFCLFQPGKAELALDMLDWLNHTSPLDDAGTWRLVMIPLGLVGGALVFFGLWTARRDRAVVLLAACAVFGWSVACVGTGAWTRAAMGPLVPQRDALDVVVDRTRSDVPLSHGAYTTGGGRGFGLLEQWIPRIGAFTSRRTGMDVFSGEGLVVICPTEPVDEAYRRRLVEYVTAGGRLLVIDSPDNDRSTANSLLWSFGLSLESEQPVRGEVVVAGGSGRLADETAWPVFGGSTLARIGTAPVAATTSLGRGRVTVIGLGGSFNDARMGDSWQPQPDDALRARYDALLALLRAALGEK